MAIKISARAKRAGFTLITALAFSVVVGTVLAGVGTVAVSHVSRSKVEGTYANAVALADAGVNYEIQRISSDPTNTTLPDQEVSPRTVSVDTLPGMTGMSGSFKVFIRPWGTACNGSGTWKAPSDFCIVSEGTVDGITRKVQVHGRRKSIFDEYALYAYKNGTFNGGGQSNTQIVGDLGTNGGVTFNGSTNTNMVVGNLDLNGYPTATAGKDNDGSNVIPNPDPVIMPDVSQVAALQFPGSPAGLSWLQTHNNNAAIRQLSSADSSWASQATATGVTLAAVQALPSAGLTVSSRTFADPGNGVPSDTSTLDTSTGPRFYVPKDPVWTGNAYGLQGLRIYVVPPGDYYFNNIDFKGGTSGLLFLTHLGQIRIWIDQPSSGAVKDDNLSIPVVFTDHTPSKFRLFYNKCATLNINGSSRFDGGFYALNSTCQAKNTPGMNFNGNSTIYGSVITDYFTVGGGTKVVFPNNAGGDDPTDFSLWFGFKDGWKEVRYDGSVNPVFSDGTSN